MSDKPKLDQLNLVVRDMEASLAFYRLLGVAIPDGAVWRTESGGHHASAETDDGIEFDLDSIALAKVYDAGWRENVRAVIGFSVSSREAVDAHFAKLVAAGHSGVQEPHDAFWGVRYAIVEDPDGNHVGLMSPVDPAKKSREPAV